MELVADKTSHGNFDPRDTMGIRLMKLCEANGVILRSVANDSLCFSPPLVISTGEIDEMLDRVAESLDELTVQSRREQIGLVR